MFSNDEAGTVPVLWCQLSEHLSAGDEQLEKMPIFLVLNKMIKGEAHTWYLVFWIAVWAQAPSIAVLHLFNG